MRRILNPTVGIASYLMIGYHQYSKQYLHFDINETNVINRESVPKPLFSELALILTAWPYFIKNDNYKPSLTLFDREDYTYKPKLNVFENKENRCSYQLGERFLYPDSWDQEDRILWSPTTIESASIEKAIEHLQNFEASKYFSYKYYIKDFSFVRDNKKFTFHCCLSIDQALSILSNDENANLHLSLYKRYNDLSITTTDDNEQTPVCKMT